MQDIGELAYGGLVTLTEWWDTSRVTKGTLTKKQILKKASFYTYLVIGLGATLVSAFGWWRGKEKWMEHISHGFIYDLPRQIYNNVQDLRTPPGPSTTGAESEAVRQAREILAHRTSEARNRVNYEVTNPHEIMV
jgi:inosine/xanthosine triphosphate pyrophosphatase family protein